MTTTIREQAPATGAAPEQAPSRRWGTWPVLLLLAGYVLFCHGCHGDEDNELFSRADIPVCLLTAKGRQECLPHLAHSPHTSPSTSSAT